MEDGRGEGELRPPPPDARRPTWHCCSCRCCQSPRPANQLSYIYHRRMPEQTLEASSLLRFWLSTRGLGRSPTSACARTSAGTLCLLTGVTMAACLSSFVGTRVGFAQRTAPRSTRKSVAVSAADRTLWLPGEEEGGCGSQEDAISCSWGRGGLAASRPIEHPGSPQHPILPSSMIPCGHQRDRFAASPPPAAEQGAAVARRLRGGGSAGPPTQAPHSAAAGAIVDCPFVVCCLPAGIAAPKHLPGNLAGGELCCGRCLGQGSRNHHAPRVPICHCPCSPLDPFLLCRQWLR